ncbi:MAG TPA: type II toxin-antitoxin system HicA family toxin [Lacipirellulaceae bacterium]|nr:type II toxin-antitoxin system HicA family toxin [Lacipirellulaceae bacterium]HMP07430.1 type II toxin-antitoxin system HicA family toxin [Lacipirellulaceae bacterium]
MPRLPGVNHQDAIRALKKAGFHVARQGKHAVMTDGTRVLTIPRHNPVNAITRANVVRDAGLRIDEFKTALSARGPGCPDEEMLAGSGGDGESQFEPTSGMVLNGSSTSHADDDSRILGLR